MSRHPVPLSEPRDEVNHALEAVRTEHPVEEPLRGAHADEAGYAGD